MKPVEKYTFGRCDIEVFKIDSTTLYKFSGDLDEKFDGRKFVKPQTEIVRIHLGALRTVNSVGVREWVYLMKEFSDLPTVILEDCSVAVVDQINIVPQMLGRATVESFFAPYYCPQCDEEVTCLIRCVDHKSRLLEKKAPFLKHDKCQADLEFDALEDCYFHQIERFFKP